MKKILALVLVLAMVISLGACAKTAAPEKPDTTPDATPDAPPADATPDAPAEEGMANAITLWTYPIGSWGDQASVQAMTDAFTAETGIAVTVEYLTYADGDDKVNTALSAKQGPDLIMEGPERLVANWGDKGYMVDLSDLLDETDKSEIYDSVLTACTHTSGAVYEYPLVMTAHCMAINYTAFVESGADAYIDLESHTWTTEDFFQATQALYDYYGDTVAAVFCGGQGGDQGTRALVNNLYGGNFTTADHTAYTWDSAENVKALEALQAQDGIVFDPAIAGGDEIALFYNGTLKMAFCWNIAQQMNPNSADTGAGLTIDGDEIVFMSFPSESGESALCGGIWGFGVFDNGDAGRVAAAKEFVKYMCDSENTIEAVKTATYFAVRDSAEGADLSAIWADNEIMNEYNVLMPYLGDYYQVTAGWAEARTAWWNMLQQVGAGGDVNAAVAEFAAQANAAAG